MKTALLWLLTAGLSCFLVLSLALGLTSCASLPPPPSPQVTASTLAKISSDLATVKAQAQTAIDAGDALAAGEHLAKAEQLAALHARALKLSKPSALETGSKELAAVGELAGVAFPTASLAGIAAAAVAGIAGAVRAYQWRETARAAEIMALAIETEQPDAVRDLKLKVSKLAASQGSWLPVNQVVQRVSARVKRSA